MTIMFIQMIVGCILILLSALFSSTELAYTGLTYNQIQRIERIYPGLFEFWRKRPDQVLAVLLISNNAVNTAAGVLSAGIAVHVAALTNGRERLLILMVSLITSVLLLVFGEIIPKVLAKRFTLTWALVITPVIKIWIRIMNPISRTLVWLTHGLFLGRLKRTQATPFLRENELREILIHAAIPKSSRQILDNVIDFSRTRVQDVMVTRSNIIAFDIKEPIPKIISAVMRSGLSRIPIYSGTIDNMVGMLYSKDLLVAWRTGSLVLLEDLLRPLLHTEPTTPLPEMLRIFKSGRHHLALVKEPGDKNKIRGLVTLQDALESIVGDVKEEI